MAPETKKWLEIGGIAFIAYLLGHYSHSIISAPNPPTVAQTTTVPVESSGGPMLMSSGQPVFNFGFQNPQTTVPGQLSNDYLALYGFIPSPGGAYG